MKTIKIPKKGEEDNKLTTQTCPLYPISKNSLFSMMKNCNCRSKIESLPKKNPNPNINLRSNKLPNPGFLNPKSNPEVLT